MDESPVIIMQQNDAYQTVAIAADVPMEVNTAYKPFSPTQQQRVTAALESDYVLASAPAVVDARRQAATGDNGSSQPGAVVRRIKIPSGSVPDYGIEIGHGPAGIMVTTVTPGKLADQHGLLEGMGIVAINRASTRSMSKEAAIQLLQNARGHVDITVTLAPRSRANTGGAMARATAAKSAAIGANAGPSMGPSMAGPSMAAMAGSRVALEIAV